jgi:ActR/RegA family two-component response regulator
VLIVDDDHNFRETLRELLSDSGYQPRVATNAEEGIALLQTTTPILRSAIGRCPVAEESSFSRVSSTMGC